MHIQIIIHASFEKPGSILNWILKNNHTYTVTAPYKGESLSENNSYDFLIIMGGPQSPTHFIEYPYLKDEILFTQNAIQKNKPILGICLGAQIIGEALGAKTMRSPNKEVGAFPISLTQEGMHDPIFKNFPKQFDVMHWHNDMPGLSDNAVIIAESEGCPRQVVRYDEKIYGLQCHFEMTRELVDGMLNHCENDLNPSRYTQASEKMILTDFESINKKLDFILDYLAN